MVHHRNGIYKGRLYKDHGVGIKETLHETVKHNKTLYSDRLHGAMEKKKNLNRLYNRRKIKLETFFRAKNG